MAVVQRIGILGRGSDSYAQVLTMMTFGLFFL